MESEVLTLLQNGGVTSFLVAVLFMAYKVGKFFAPLISGYIERQSINSESIAKTLSELAQLQSVSNVRLASIEKQLTLFEGIFNEERIK